MLIKLSTGHEINTDRIDYLRVYEKELPGKIVAGAQIGHLMFDLTAEEYAQVKAYHTKAVVVEAEKPDCGGAQHEKRECQNCLSWVKCKCAHKDGDNCTYPSFKYWIYRKLAPFTVKTLPELKPDPKIMEAYDAAMKKIRALCSECKNYGTKECGSCMTFIDNRCHMQNFEPR